MDILDLFGTDPLSGISIPERRFDTNDPLRFARQHMNRDKLSLALYDQILTIQQFRLHHAYESMSETQQRILKGGRQKLIEIGISKSELEAGTSGWYSGKVKQWITLDDFKSIFPDTLKFTFTYHGDQ
ncbi:MAG: hypothetical protein ACFFG0_16675 [Candidatus Thorarchaeota archaeon]